VGYRPRTRREALLIALSDYSGTGLSTEDLTEDLSAHEIAEMILRREGLDPAIDRQQYERVVETTIDWLFDRRGRGARSGLPR
jgi:hypothetical protein